MQEGLAYAAVAATVWLGWEVVKAPLAERAAVSLAIRLAPGSPSVLARAAEAELLAQRYENARALAEESLGRAPFNSRALRVRGLAEAQLGSTALADQILTLAGNWSLRDDPAHAWLIENRLRRGDYGSAFAHADTLARRRPDLYESLFRLFTTAGSRDPRALPVISRLVAADPPWRAAYIAHLLRDPHGPPVVGGLALALHKTDSPFTPSELEQLYTKWLADGRLEGVRELRERLRLPNADPYLQNGNFSDPIERQIQPFGWALGVGPGINTAIVEDDFSSANMAFRVQYDGFAVGVFNRQLLILPPGSYVLTGRWRAETPGRSMPLEWRVICANSDAQAEIQPTRLQSDTPDWKSFTVGFRIPAENCSAQWLQLSAVPADQRRTIASWFDDLRLRPTEVFRGRDPSRGPRRPDSTTEG